MNCATVTLRELMQLGILRCAPAPGRGPWLKWMLSEFARRGYPTSRDELLRSQRLSPHGAPALKRILRLSPWADPRDSNGDTHPGLGSAFWSARGARRS